jgi:hypothetical protein
MSAVFPYDGASEPVQGITIIAMERSLDFN